MKHLNQSRTHWYKYRRMLGAFILLAVLLQAVYSKLFVNLGCPNHSFLQNEIYLSGGLNALRAKSFRAETFFEYPKMLYWLRVIPQPLLGSFTTGYLLRATGLFDVATMTAGDKTQIGFKLAGDSSYQIAYPDAAGKELLIMITAPINYDGSSGRLTMFVGDLSPLAKLEGDTLSASDMKLANVTFKPTKLTLPAGAYSAFYDGTKPAGQRTSELRLGAGNNVCGAPPCTVGDYRGAIREFNVLPFVILTDDEFSVVFSDKTWSFDGSRLNKEYVYYTVMAQLPGAMDCIATARVTSV